MSRSFGVHSEVGKLRTVMVCPPGRAHERLTPGNCHDLLFDDVIWVHEARKDHYDFVTKMEERGVEVLDFPKLLGEALDDKEARAFVLDRRVTPHTVGPGAARAMRPWLDEIPGAELSRLLIGGISMLDVPKSEWSKMLTDAAGATSFLIPPIPNTLFQRDPSCWIYKGVTCNPMYWPARQLETLLQRAVYKFHPIFKGGDFSFWFGDSDEDFATATLEGGDVMPIGKGIVLIGMGERSTRQAVSQVAAVALRPQRRDPRHRLPHAQEPRGHASGHGLQLLRPGCLHRVPRGGRPDPMLQLVSRECGGRHRGPEGQGHHARGRARRSRSQGAAGRRRPAAMPGRPSASSGMTATTSSPSSPASWSATTATPIPTRCCARRG